MHTERIQFPENPQKSAHNGSNAQDLSRATPAAAESGRRMPSNKGGELMPASAGLLIKPVPLSSCVCLNAVTYGPSDAGSQIPDEEQLFEAPCIAMAYSSQSARMQCSAGTQEPGNR